MEQARSASPDTGRIEPGDLLTTEEAARFLSLERGTLLNWRWAGKKAPRWRKLGRSVRYLRQDLEAFIADSAGGAGGAGAAANGATNREVNKEVNAKTVHHEVSGEAFTGTAHASVDGGVRDTESLATVQPNRLPTAAAARLRALRAQRGAK